MSPTRDPDSLRLPDGVRRQFTELERALWRLETGVAFSWAICGLLGSFLAVFILDRFWDTPQWLRLGLVSLGGVSLLAALLFWVDRWGIRRRGLTALARLVQARYRGLGDRLLSLVELSDPAKRPEHFSPDLYRAAIRQVGEEAERLDFRDAVNRRPLRLAKRAAITGGVLVAIPSLLFPSAAWNALQRWGQPLDGPERYTLVRVNGLPADRTVAHGEAFPMAFDVEYRSIWRPDPVYLRFDREPWMTGTVSDSGQLRMELPGRTENTSLEIRAGDARQTVQIVPKHRPSLRALSAELRMPDYLRYPTQSEKVTSGSLTALEGSEVVLRGEVSRELASAEMRLDDQEPILLGLDGRRFESPPIEVEDVFKGAFNWRDVLGLTSAAPWELTFDTVSDQPPHPRLADRGRRIAILENTVLPISVEATDDYGVKWVGLQWEAVGVDNGEEDAGASRRETRAEAPDSQQTDWDHEFRFSPAKEGVPTDTTVELRGAVVDFHPARDPVLTETREIHVVSLTQHAEDVRRELESVLQRTEEITRREEGIHADAESLLQKGDEALSDNRSEEELGQLTQEQRENAEQLERLAEEGMQVLKEGLRNPLFDESTLREWSENLHAMQTLGEREMAEATRSLDSARQSGQSRRESLEQAEQEVESILEELERMQHDVNQGLDDLQALTLAERLREVGTEETEIQERLGRVAPDVVGRFPEDLSAELRELEKGLAGDQRETQEKVGTLQEEIGRFYERTQIARYGEVYREMDGAGATESLHDIEQDILNNIVVDSMAALGDWADRFDNWADRLEPEESEGGEGQGGQGESEMGEQLMEQLLGLLRLREGEQELRDQTAIWDDPAEGGTPTDEDTAPLADRQREIRDKLTDVQTESPMAVLDAPLEDAERSMQTIERRLSNRRIDEATLEEQDLAIAHLSDAINLINELSQKSSQSQSQSRPQEAGQEAMAFLMEMMGQGSQLAQSEQGRPTGGGNLAGGTTDEAASPISGDARGTEEPERTVSRAGGIPDNFPVEYRDVLENYFRAVEQQDESE